MSERNWQLRIGDILASIERIERYTNGLSQRDLTENVMVVDAVAHNLEIIREAAKKTPLTIQEENPHIPWDEMWRMRNIIIHEYAGVSLEIVWQTIIEDLPPIKAPLQLLLGGSG